MFQLALQTELFAVKYRLIITVVFKDSPVSANLLRFNRRGYLRITTTFTFANSIKSDFAVNSIFVPEAVAYLPTRKTIIK